MLNKRLVDPDENSVLKTDTNGSGHKAEPNDNSLHTDMPMKDIYTKLDTTTLLRHSTNLTPKEQEIVLNIFKHIAKTAEDSKFKETVLQVKNWNELTKLMKKDLVELKMMKENENLSPEYIMVQAAINFHIEPKSLLMTTMAIHFRVKPNEGRNDWLDNFTINNFLLQLTTVEFENKEEGNDFKNDKATLTIDLDTNKDNFVNKNKKLDKPKEILFELGNKYRLFNEFGISEENELETEDNNEITKMLDRLVMKYPYYTYTCHGCDVFTNGMMKINLYDIYQFTKRYPYVVVGGILNSKTYASGRGEHWVAVLFINGQCYLLCSFGSSFNSLFVNDSKTEFLDQIINAGFGMQYNGVKIQEDSCNCGVYSILFNLISLIVLEVNEQDTGSKIDIPKIIDKIGNNASKINKEGIYNIKEMLIGW